MRRIVIIGGGVAGVTIARTIKEKANGAAEINVITKDRHYTAGPSRPLILTGEQQVDRITRGYEELIRDGVKVTFGTVSRIDPAERRVELVQSPPTSTYKFTFNYDILVLSPGVVYDGSTITGYGESGGRIANVYELGRVHTLKNWLNSITRGRVIVYAPPMPYRCAPAPSETTLLTDAILRARKVRENVEIVHVDANDTPQPAVIGGELSRIMEEAGVKLITKTRITEVYNDRIVLSDGETLAYDILAMLEPNRAPDFVVNSGLGNPWFEARAPTDLRHVKYDDILAAGDVAKLPFPKN